MVCSVELSTKKVLYSRRVFETNGKFGKNINMNDKKYTSTDFILKSVELQCLAEPSNVKT